LPYGISKKHGGDSLENVAKVKSCVDQVMKRDGVSKESAIRICKDSIFGGKKKRRS
jgi:hypothetical protein